MNTPRLALLLGPLVVISALHPRPAMAENQNEQRLDVTLTPSLFAPGGVVGDATYTIRRHRSDFEVEVEDLDPGSYDVFVGGVVVGQIAAVPVAGGTEGYLEFSTHPVEGKLPLGFDPRGKSIDIVIGSTIMLSGSFPTMQNPEAPRENATFNNVVETVNAAAPGIGPRPRGTLKLVAGGRHASLLFKLQRLEKAPHVITANGVEVAHFTPLAGGIARVRFSTNPGKNDFLLDFDPIDTTFQVLLNGEVVLEFQTGHESIGGGATPIGMIEASFNRTEADDDASGTATLRDRATRFDFEVEVEDLPVGSYDLLVGGVKQGVIVVKSAGAGTKGVLEFSTESAAGKLSLAFDPRGQTIQIVEGVTVFLSMTFPV